MKWFLVFVLITPGAPALEQHVAIQMPNEAACEVIRENFVYAAQIIIHTGDDERMPMVIDEKTCVEADEDSAA